MIDVRALLPQADWSIGSAPKSSVTVHWNGPPVDYAADPLEVARADARFHIDKDWAVPESPDLIEPPVHGDGIQYHRLYAPDGSVLMTRDEDAVLWHCGDAEGNVSSAAWQVMTGEGQQATPAQLASLARDLAGQRIFGHRDWSATACPGDALYAFIKRGFPQEADMDEEATKATIRVMLESEEGGNLVYDAVMKKYAPALQAQLDELRTALEAADTIEGIKSVVSSLLQVQEAALKPRAVGGST